MRRVTFINGYADMLTEKLIDDFLRPFSPTQVANLMTMALEMETYGLTATEVVAICGEYMELYGRMGVTRETNPVAAQPAIKNLTVPRCPDCGAVVIISPVNVSRCTNVGGDWKTSLQCTNKSCRFTELSIKTITEWRNR